MKVNNTPLPIMIDAALVSAQRRKRLFWTNIPNVKQPEDRGIFLKDILEDGIGESVAFRNRGNGKKPEYNKTGKANALTTVQTDSMVDSVYQYRRTYWRETKGGKVPVLTANMGTGGNNVPYVANKSYCIPSTYYKENVKSLIKRKKNGLMVKEATKKGYAIAKDGDAIDLSFPNSKTRRGRVGNKVKNLMTGSDAIKVFTNGNIRKLTPIECERLQSLPEITKSCIIEVCSEPQKNRVSVAGQNHRSPQHAGNVEKIEQEETVKSVEQSLSIKYLPTSKRVRPDVSINLSENKIEIYNHGKLLFSASGAEEVGSFPLQRPVQDFAHLAVGLNTILEETMHSGAGELHLKSKRSAINGNGETVVSLYGKGITQLAKDAEIDSTTLSKLLKSTISVHSGLANNERTVQILSSYVASAIVGYIPKEMRHQNILTLELKTKVGYTWGVSTTQRYKALGNAFNVDVVAHILRHI